MNNACGCCTPLQHITPLQILNRPGLASVSYRIGKFGSFRRAMIVALQKPDSLGSLTARDSNDYGIAVVEMAAYIYDILTFYSERVVNEAYVRTAVHTESVRRLAALLDYHPSPGVAASALLAVTLEPKKKLIIPVGLRVQSVPEQDQKPQKFESIETVEASALLNRIAILPAPAGQNALGAGKLGGLLLSAPTDLRPGTPVIGFNEGTPGLEEKQIAQVITTGSRTDVSYEPAMAATRTKMFVWRRKFQLLGIHAPRTTIVSEPASPGSNVLKFHSVNVLVDNEAGNKIWLDGVVSDLKPNTRVLVSNANTTTVRKIESVTLEERTIQQPGSSVVADVFRGVVTAITFDGLALAAFPITSALVYELGEEITFQPVHFDPSIPMNTTVLAVEAEVSGEIAEGRTLILDDVAGDPQNVTVTAVSMSDAWRRIAITPGLKRAFDTASAFAWANIVHATHGETVKEEILGDGDASRTFQSFPLAKSPLTFVPQADAPNGAGSTLQVRVNGILWNEKPYLLGEAPDARTFIARRDEKERTTIRFGDSVTGARVWTGKANISATYRVGIGELGNVDAGAIKNPLDRPVGLRSVVNPLAAQGGAGPESISDTRRNAPNTVRTFGRIVSLEDIVDIAREFAGVGKASVSLEWSGEEQVAYLTVAGIDGAAITGTVKENLMRYLDARRDPNRALVVREHISLEFEVQAGILVDPAFVAEKVQEEVHAAATNFFAFDRQALGRPVFLSEVVSVAHNVPGVVAVDVNRLRYKSAAIRVVRGATATISDRLQVFAQEIAKIENPVTDVVISLGLS